MAMNESHAPSLAEKLQSLPKQAIYGMPYEEWKEKYQTELTDKQQQAYQDTKPLHAVIDVPKG